MAEESTIIEVGGMSCQGCVKNVTGVLTALAGVSQAAVSLEAGQATVTYDAAQVTRTALCAAVEDAGFDAK